jgi:outer membrane protein assembly factor BamB
MTMRSRLVAMATGVTMILAAGVGLASSASAAFSPTPSGPAWTPDGPVNAVVVYGGRVFIGGSFTGGVAALDADTGARLWTSSVNGDVRALAMSSDGDHVVAGGKFSSVSGVTHRKLALLSVSTGQADRKWKPTVGGAVRDIVVRGNTAYFGGSFESHNGIPQVGLGAVSVNPGSQAVPVPRASFDVTTNGVVYSLAMSGSRLVIGGRFTAVNGASRAQLASFDVDGNALNAWRPAAACLNCNLYWDLVVNDSTVYGASRNAGAVTAVNLITGSKVWRTPANANGDAQALTFVDGPTPLLYVGGHFTTIRGQPRTIVAALNPSTGALDEFSTRFRTTYPGVWGMASTSSRLYVGGHFTAAGPIPNRYPYFAMFGN